MPYSDFLAEMPLESWMDNARDNELPPSRRAVANATKLVEPSRGRVPLPRLDNKSEFARRPCANAGRGVLD